jgi:hypothetical protein
MNCSGRSPLGKNFFSQAVSVFFYCNFFIAACAAALLYETCYLLHLLPSMHWFILLSFFCTMNVYTFHYYLKCVTPVEDDRINWYRKHTSWIWLLLVIGACVIAWLLITHFTFLFSHKNFLWTLFIPILSIGYSFPFLPGRRALRHLGWLKLPLLSFVWSFTTVSLPVLYSTANSVDRTQIQVLFINRFLFILALCVLFNLRDYEEDKADKVMTPAVLLGPGKVLSIGKWILSALNLIAGILLAWVFHFHSSVAYAAIILPIVLLFLLFQFFSFSKTEMQFLFLNDGLMPVKALLLIFAIAIS